MNDPAPGDVTTRRCPGCGEVYDPRADPEKHGRCSTGPDPDATLRAPERLTDVDPESEVPPDARLASADPANIVSQYVLVTLLGKGGMGSVWKAWDRTLSRWVAIKFLLTFDEESILRFQREARLAAGLRHPNIAPIFEIGRSGDRHFIAMEYIDGVSLDRLEIAIPDLVDLFIKVCAGVEAAHKAGVVHRDLKPQNIMVSRQERWPYVMDFGLAKALKTGSALSFSGAIMGTPAYMPPEQAAGKLDEIDARSDVYGLGATLYALLAKRPPFSGQTAMEILLKVGKEAPVPPRSINPAIPEPLQAVILKAMARERKDRHTSAAGFGSDLRRVLGGDAIALPKARAPRGLIAAAVVLVALAAAIPLLRSGAPPGPSVPGDPATFTLKIAGTPSTRVTKVLRDDEEVALLQHDIPMVLTGLKPGAYEIRFEGPDRGTHALKVPEERFEAGKTYQVWGTFGRCECSEVTGGQ